MQERDSDLFKSDGLTEQSGEIRVAVSERYADFIDSFDPGMEDELEDLYREARSEDIPVIRRHTISLLRFLIKTNKPENILEIGTAVGFSALLMNSYQPEGGHITTIENYEKRIPRAKENFCRFGKEDSIELIEGDALKITEMLPKAKYDMVFMDGAKGQYITLLPAIKRLLKSGGILISDNVLSDGQIVESRYAVERRNRTIHKRMREYLFALTHDDELVTTILSDGDGVALSYRL